MSMRAAITRADELERLLTSQAGVAPREATLMKVISATAIGVGGYRWLYGVRLAVVGSTALYVPQEDEAVTMDAISVSELSNVVLTSYSYGVPLADIPGGYFPVQIPTGTYVQCVPHRRTDGSFIWLIVNTQAITGQCNNPLASEQTSSDYGLFTAPANTDDYGTFSAPWGSFDYGLYASSTGDFGTLLSPFGTDDFGTFSSPTDTDDYGTY